MAKSEKSKWDKQQCRKKMYSCNKFVARQRKRKERSATQWRKNIRDDVKKVDALFIFLHQKGQPQSAG